jgi:hypothetical protein
VTNEASRALRSAVLSALALCLAARPSPADPVVGAWSEVFDWPLVAIHMAQLHTGEVLVISSQLSGGGLEPEDPHLWNPAGDCFDEAGGCFTPKPNPVDIFCGGHTHLDDGTVIVNGGHVQNHIGESETFLFEYDHDAGDWNWTALGEVEDTDHARWYPTLTTLPDGRVINVSGSQKRCSSGPDQGQLCVVHADCPPAETPNCEAYLVPEPEIFDPADRTWTTLSGIGLSVEFYPFNFIGPDGHVFFAGADAGAGTYDIPPTLNFNYVLGDPPSLDFVDFSTHAGGSAVLYAPGRILKTGGWTSPPDASADAEIIDLNGAATWVATDPMNVPRRRHNLTVLPDGTVLATGGTRRGNQEFERTCGGVDGGASCGNDDDCPGEETCEENPSGVQFWVAEAEIWDPATGEWTLMAGAQRPRMYHSTAMLMPDGRVVSAGGGRGGGATNHYPDAEFFSPPYLFTGTPPPTIADAPEIIHYGRSFRVESPESADVDRVSLVRLAAVTHSFDQDRRFVPLTFNPAGDFGLDVDAPASPNVAPPGYYMLFLLSEEGVPSVARFVRLLPADPGAGATHEYAAKVVCGVGDPESATRREPGHYATSVNIHNPGPGRRRFFKKLALTFPPGDQREGDVLPIGHHALAYDEALQSDCADLRRRLIPGGSAPFFEGFLVIQSHGPLDVTAVYTTSDAGANGEPAEHSSVDVERVPERRPETDLGVNKAVVLLPRIDVGAASWHIAYYTINVTNTGPGAAGAILLNDDLALDAVNSVGGAVIVTDPITLPPGATITSTAQPAANLSSITIDLGDLAPGGTATVSFWALALTVTFGDLDPHVRLRDTATVTSAAVETAPANNTVTVETVLIP